MENRRRVLVQVPRTGDVFTLTGRAAEMVVLIVAAQEKINALEVGQLVLDFTQRKIKPALREQMPPVDLGETA